MRVLVFAATGFIGHEVARAYIRAGHRVIGTTRSDSSAKALRSEEIEGFVCDPSKVDQWKHLLAEVDVVVDCIGGDEIASLPHIILDTIIAEAPRLRPQGPPLAYTYCSGTWVHGDSKTAQRSDRSPIDAPMLLTKWRLDIEQKAIKAISRSFTANVVRPSIVYGGPGSSLIGMVLFSSAKAGKISWFGSERARVATIHREDLGELFRLVGEKSLMVPGIIFDGSNNHPESIETIIAELKRVSGTQSVEFKEPENDFHRALASTCLLHPTLGRSLLGWEPRRLPLIEGMDLYYDAWLSQQ